jgi:hypothetical protein
MPETPELISGKKYRVIGVGLVLTRWNPQAGRYGKRESMTLPKGSIIEFTGRVQTATHIKPMFSLNGFEGELWPNEGGNIPEDSIEPADTSDDKQQS